MFTNYTIPWLHLAEASTYNASDDEEVANDGEDLLDLSCSSKL